MSSEAAPDSRSAHTVLVLITLKSPVTLSNFREHQNVILRRTAQKVLLLWMNSSFLFSFFGGLFKMSCTFSALIQPAHFPLGNSREQLAGNAHFV